MPSDLVLDVDGLSVSFPTARGDVHAVRDVALSVRRGEIVGIVGESGSGKTVTALAIAQLVSYPGVVTVERYRFDGRDVVDLPQRERRRLLATSLPMVFQNPGTSLNPAVRVGRQLAEVSEVHDAMSRTAATQRAVDKLRQRRHRRPGTARACLSARAFRRHEAARRDRHGADGQAQAVHRRRADDRPRRHRATADLRPASPGEPGRGRVRAAHLPRHRRGRRALQPDRRDVRRAGRRGGRHGDRGGWRGRPPVHAGARRRRSRHGGRPRSTAGDDPGPAARSARAGARLCVRATLPHADDHCRAERPTARAARATAGASPAGIRRSHHRQSADQQVVRS